MADSNVKASASLVRIEASAAYQDAVATGIALDADSLNKYLRVDEISLVEGVVASVTKTTLDTLGLSESAVAEVQKALDDALAFSDVAVVELRLNRSFAGSNAFADASVLGIGKGVPEELFFSEDVNASIDLDKLDFLSLNESLVPEVAFDRAFTDVFSLDDAATVDAFSKATDSSKTNVFAFSDDSSAVVGKGLADSFSIVELPLLGLKKPATDSIAVADAFSRVAAFSRAFDESLVLSENVDISLLSPHTSVLNASTLNTFSLNS